MRLGKETSKDAPMCPGYLGDLRYKGTGGLGSGATGHVQRALQPPPEVLEAPNPHVPHEACVRGDRVPRHHQMLLRVAAQALTERFASLRKPHLQRHLGANDLRMRSSTQSTPAYL